MNNARVLGDGATPAEVAQAALDGIEFNRDAFAMDSWVTGLTPLLPDDVPSACGTTLCAAGWVAHVTGWTLLGNGVATRRENGLRRMRATASVAQDALGLKTGQTFWYASEETAYNCLQDIAAGRPPVIPED